MESKHRLNVISDNSSNPSTHKIPRRQEVYAHFEHLWKTNPEQFDPSRNCMEIERIERTWNLILEFVNPQDQTAVDLGCGTGALARRLTKAGAHVHAVDAAKIPLNELEEKSPKVAIISQDCLPKTVLEDDTYDLVVSTEVIAYLEPKDYRLYFAELSRLVHSHGFVVCSSPVDFNSIDAIERFANLAETELKVDKWIFSSHLLSIRLWEFVETPQTYTRGRNDSLFREKQLDKRKGFSRVWFQFNTTFFPFLGWSLLSLVTKPLVRWIKRSRFLLLKLEKICRFFWDESGISHVILIGKRRPLAPPFEIVPREMKHKRQVWE